jgi:hypothetical protein
VWRPSAADAHLGTLGAIRWVNRPGPVGLARLSRCGAETDGLRGLSAAIPDRLGGSTSSHFTMHFGDFKRRKNTYENRVRLTFNPIDASRRTTEFDTFFQFFFTYIKICDGSLVVVVSSCPIIITVSPENLRVSRLLSYPPCRSHACSHAPCADSNVELQTCSRCLGCRW